MNRGSIVTGGPDRLTVRGVPTTHTHNTSTHTDNTPPPKLDHDWLLFTASRQLADTLITALKEGEVDSIGVPSLRLPRIRREEVSLPHLGCVSISADPKPQLIASPSEVCQLVPHTPEFAIHLLRRMAWNTTTDQDAPQTHTDAHVDAYVIQLLSDVAQSQELAPCMSNLKEAFMWIVHTTAVRTREAHSSEESQMDRYRGPTVAELFKSPVALSCDVAYGELFRTYYILVLPPIDKRDVTSRPTEYRLLPLDEAHDLVPISRVFKATLADHFHEIRSDMSAESLADFSFFTAHYVLKKVCETIRWIPHFLLLEDGQEFDEGLHNLAMDVCEHPFTALQILRALNISVKNGFEVIMREPERLQSSTPPTIFDMLAAVENGCRGITITKKVGVRMVYGWIKYVLLTCLGAFMERGKVISPSTIINWNLRVASQNKGIANHDTSFKADLITLQSKCRLIIMSLKDLKEEAQDCLELLTENTQTLIGGIPNALDEAFNMANIGIPVHRWCTWNYDISFVGEMTKQIVCGHTSREALLNLWKRVLDGTGVSDNEIWYQAVGAGSTFRISMPSSIVESLDEKGLPTCPMDFDENDNETYLVLLPHRDLSWDWKVRLKDLYRLKSVWSNIELAVWLGPCLKYRDAPSIDFIVSEHLRPVSGRGGNLYENATLHLERHD